MTIYAYSPTASNPIGYLIGSVIDELHLFAKQLGLKREKCKGEDPVYYELSQDEYQRALELNATPLDTLSFVEAISCLRKE